ncbi:lipid-A-disaccharide synthase [Pseudoruegeria aquimaris]|uniref:Lipid-A-disaccharide synthase n=1 Tax=Pseudoruegeria aquimaris TaxID=393663 RepID=A0A1Y5T4F9_9RHOB|nr:lipid-A-disaccharide synthase N-terminal domain-containing protein [Pseudoruegeria aquimaris]SLN52136.1 lipid-A-disaccharide synthase [Pseudoruegeria aquimaris]
MTFFYQFLGVETTAELLWVLFGLGGQLLFTARFLVQWIASERAGRSTVPIAFWYFSIAGGIVLLSYAIHRADPVFILGQSMGVFIYARNLWLIRRERLAAE